jgi:antitoxin component YwqK of YwqJK toxin-antitoxin module
MAGCFVIALQFWKPVDQPVTNPIPPVEVLRSDLELREDKRLYQHGSSEAFSGLLVEDFSREARKLEIEIHDGKAHGSSRGWFENGQIEVEETFIEGVSNGLRTRWYESGQKRSQAKIVDGVIDGSYLEWHDNGTKAVAMSLKKGVADGLAETWHPSGILKSRFEYDDGKVTRRKTWPDSPANGVIGYKGD